MGSPSALTYWIEFHSKRIDLRSTMGSCTSNEKERAEKERAEEERAEKERAEKERAEKERAEKERAEEERVAKAKAVNLVTAVKENRLADVQLVCQYAPEKVNDEDRFGQIALDMAIDKNLLAVAELLVQAKADVNVQSDSGNRGYALHWTASMNSLAMAELLVQAKADVHAKDQNGFSALHIAAWSKSLPIAELLVQAKVDVNAKNNEGKSALHIAAGNQEMITLLSQ